MEDEKLVKLYYQKCIEYVKYRIDYESGFVLRDIQPIIDKLPKYVRGIIHRKIYKYLKHKYIFNKYTYKNFLNSYIYW